MFSSGGRQLPPTRARASFVPIKGEAEQVQLDFAAAWPFRANAIMRSEVTTDCTDWNVGSLFTDLTRHRRQRWGLRAAGRCERTDVTVPGRWRWRGFLFFSLSNLLCIKHDLPAFWDGIHPALSHRLETLQCYFISHPDKILMEPTLNDEWIIISTTV